MCVHVERSGRCCLLWLVGCLCLKEIKQQQLCCAIDSKVGQVDWVIVAVVVGANFWVVVLSGNHSSKWERSDRVVKPLAVLAYISWCRCRSYPCGQVGIRNYRQHLLLWPPPCPHRPEPPPTKTTRNILNSYSGLPRHAPNICLHWPALPCKSSRFYTVPLSLFPGA